jgi:hypothetical protein
VTTPADPRQTQTQTQTQALLRERYGRRGPGRPVVLLAVAVVAVSLGWLAWATWAHATPTVESELLGYAVVDEHAATARVEVAVRTDDDPDAAGVRCLVRATSVDHTPVGELSWVPTDGRQEVSIRTERRATSVELVGCTAGDQARPR